MENNNTLPVESVCLATPNMGSDQETSYKSAPKSHVQTRQQQGFFVEELPLCVAINMSSATNQNVHVKFQLLLKGTELT